jgi:hypothetical protein
MPTRCSTPGRSRGECALAPVASALSLPSTSPAAPSASVAGPDLLRNHNIIDDALPHQQDSARPACKVHQQPHPCSLRCCCAVVSTHQNG